MLHSQQLNSEPCQLVEIASLLVPWARYDHLEVALLLQSCLEAALLASVVLHSQTSLQAPILVGDLSQEQ